MTHSEFAAKAGLSFSAAPADDNPHMTDASLGMRHWLCILRRKGKETMRVPFSQGSAYKDPPTVADVLWCLASDATSWEDCAGSFESWAEEFGYDTDSRRGEQTFKAVRRQSRALRTLLGDDLYNELLYETEEG